jgi:ABC-type lipoprotein export system ATPase subunit
MTTAPILIQTESVSREYQLGETVIRADDEISLSVQRGEFLALLGSSGSGTSTLLSMLAGLDRPTSGRFACKNAISLSWMRKSIATNANPA